MAAGDDLPLGSWDCSLSLPIPYQRVHVHGTAIRDRLKHSVGWVIHFLNILKLFEAPHHNSYRLAEYRWLSFRSTRNAITNRVCLLEGEDTAGSRHHRSAKLAQSNKNDLLLAGW